jgi:uncharacterized protein YunC (DUF1805 family)
VSISLQGLGLQKDKLAAGGGIDTSDPAMQASVNAVANGSLKLADVFGRGATTAQKAQFAAAVKAVNPNYNSGDHDIENASRKYFIIGQGGTSINSMQTTLHHLDLLSKAADDLQNGDVKVLSSLANELGIQLGSDKQTNYNLIRDGVAMEAARAYIGGVPGEGEINDFRKNFGTDNSLKSQKGGIQTVKGMLGGKMQSLREQAEAGSRGQANFGGSSGGSTAPQASGMAVSLKDAMALPQFKGKSQDEVTAAIKAAGHEVRP